MVIRDRYQALRLRGDFPDMRSGTQMTRYAWLKDSIDPEAGEQEAAA